MATAKVITSEQRNQIRSFTRDIILLAKRGDRSTSTAFAVYRSYNGSSIPELARVYRNSLNGSCPKTKERIGMAVETFNQAKNHIENGKEYRPFGMGTFALDFIQEMSTAGGSADIRAKARAVENFSDPQSIQLVQDHAKRLEEKGFPSLAQTCEQAIATFHDLKNEAITEGLMPIRSYHE